MSANRVDTQPTPAQIARAERSAVLLQERMVPTYWHPLYVEDDTVAVLQQPEEVARRTLVLWAVELRAEGADQPECESMIDGLGLWASVSSQELQFLTNQTPDPDQCRNLVWRLESISVMLWALRHVDQLSWPSEMCNSSEVARIIVPYEGDPEFISRAVLRPVSEILDAQDLTMKINWAIRNERRHGSGFIPRNLDWRDTSNMIPLNMSHGANIVIERHWSLTWLVNGLNPKCWDEVETHT